MIPPNEIGRQIRWKGRGEMSWEVALVIWLRLATTRILVIISRTINHSHSQKMANKFICPLSAARNDLFFSNSAIMADLHIANSGAPMYGDGNYTLLWAALRVAFNNNVNNGLKFDGAKHTIYTRRVETSEPMMIEHTHALCHSVICNNFDFNFSKWCVIKLMFYERMPGTRVHMLWDNFVFARVHIAWLHRVWTVPLCRIAPMPPAFQCSFMNWINNISINFTPAPWVDCWLPLRRVHPIGHSTV